ncbi:unnamed protein product [Paramecium octaurelia]|uniref:EGF-like domain-containing protein n=1 Tax=Paramecium octaurelia TaxID=43137 RepID=A0A8S1YHB1_PAROT|nr:unnamed protein product [Paramecium octaurelia]
MLLRMKIISDLQQQKIQDYQKTESNYTKQAPVIANDLINILFMFMIIILIISFAKSQWVIANYFLTSQQIYQKSSYCYNYYTEYFCEATSYTTANFITCQQPQRSFITLNQSFKGIRQYSTYSFNSGYFISFDLYFGGKWVNDEVVFEVGSFQNKFSYTSPDIYPITQGFCDSLQTDVKTVNFTIPSYQSGQMKFSLSTKNAGSVSINMIITSRKSSIICYPSCSACIGPEQNQCLSCFYGVPANNKCPQCPNNLYYEKNSGCKINCKFENSKFSNGFCQAFDYYSLILFDYYIGEVSMLKWQQLYDPLHISTYPQYTYTGSNNYAYGIFRYNSGIGRYINEITASSSTSTYGYGLRIQLQLFDNLQLGTGIRFMINNTYYSSIYKDSQGIQTHRISIGSQSQYSFNSYMMTTLDLYMFVDMLQYPFYFSAIGNLTGSSGWGLMSLQFTKGLCPRNCQMCDVPYQCKKCYSGYFVNKDGNCIYSCSSFTQKVVGDYCQEYEDEIPYSKYLIKDFYDLANDQDQYPEYKLLSQEGVNFLKGEYIHYSTYNSIRIFGGQYVWSQAVFQRIHQISNKPHHRITISFRIVFGPNFPSDSRFIYTVDDNAPISNSRQGSSPFFIKNTFVHTQDELTVKWECYGVNNEPINAYCGFYNYFIVVHYCQPYCLQCTDQDTCLEWEQYDQVQIQLSQTECQSEQYYDKFELKCKSCPSSCLTCQSSYYCLTCKPTFILTKLGCVCQTNQYDEANQCMNCPQQCEQCLNSSFCVNCSFQKYRTLMNGQCVCLDGYYSIPTNPQCQRCHYFCKTCSGYSQCIECQNINNIEKVDSTCKCKAGTAYQDSLKTCAACHQTCLTCFKISISGCLTCNSVQKRVLRGLKCECQPGYYELNNICEDCPNLEDNQLSQLLVIVTKNQSKIIANPNVETINYSFMKNVKMVIIHQMICVIIANFNVQYIA